MNATCSGSVCRKLAAVMMVLWLIAGCGPTAATPALSPTPTVSPTSTPFPTATVPADDGGLSGDEIATLMSLEQVDGFPLYTMRFVAAYSQGTQPDNSTSWLTIDNLRAAAPGQAGWSCSLFATLGDDQNALYGRNFDWQYSPALFLFTDPPDGYASVSMVDIDYLGLGGDRAANLTELPLRERRPLLGAPGLPFDGMNDRGLTIGMAAVPPGDMSPDPQKVTINRLMVIREMLDHASTVDEAIGILGQYNIDMGSVPLHYLIASVAGSSALVEFYGGKMVVLRNESPWQVATNFLVASTDGHPEGQCWRYDHINERLTEAGGQLATRDALSLLAEVSQNNTQWSVVYGMTSGDVSIVMGRDYAGQVHTFHLNQSGR